MELSTVQYVQLIGGLALGVAIFVAGWMVSPRITVPILVLSIPFQLIESRYGTSNMVLTYLLGAALLLRGYVYRVPLLAPIAVLLFVYAASASQVHPSTYVDHASYLVVMGSNVILFYIVYNYVRDLRDMKKVVNLLLALNAIVVAYCYLQLLIGVGGEATFGTPELGIAPNRADQRLSGPFYAVGLTSEYLVLATFICAFALMHARGPMMRTLLIVLIGANFAFLIATGNRGGVLTLMGGTALFFFFFRRELGLARIVSMSAAGVMVFSAIAFLVVNYTEFDRLLERFAETRIEGGVPDTREVTWAAALEKIPERPILGHGPRLRLYAEETRTVPGHEPIPYPHSLYLYLLYTVGVLGLTAFMVLFASVFLRLRRAGAVTIDQPYLYGFVKLGQVLLICFLVDQLKVEFLRVSLSDYQHLVFALLAVLVGAADMRHDEALQPAGAEPRPTPGAPEARLGTTRAGRA